MEYTIVGDTKNYKDCLITMASTKEIAERTLRRMLTNPNSNDKLLMNGHTNLRIKEVNDRDCWWNDRFLMSD